MLTASRAQGAKPCSATELRRTLSDVWIGARVWNHGTALTSSPEGDGGKEAGRGRGSAVTWASHRVGRAGGWGAKVAPAPHEVTPPFPDLVSQQKHASTHTQPCQLPLNTPWSGAGDI